MPIEVDLFWWYQKFVLSTQKVYKQQKYATKLKWSITSLILMSSFDSLVCPTWGIAKQPFNTGIFSLKKIYFSADWAENKF